MNKKTAFFGTILIAALSLFAQNDPSTFPVFNYYANIWSQAKSAIAAKDSSFITSYNQIIHDADSMILQGPWSVMDKTTVGASGDKHDFYGIGIYLWPDPTKPNGLPYVSLDGQTNPETQGPAYDDNRFQTMQRCVEQMGFAYYFTQNQKYAQKIDTVVKVWFLNPATKMNPNMNYAQAWPGVSTGRPEGIIASRTNRGLLDAVSLIKGTAFWSKTSDDTLNKWFTDYLNWLSTNSMALQEKNATNNHGTWYDVQAAYYALYLGKTDVATTILTGVKTRINTQIDTNGDQPQESARTRPLHYLCFNLEAMFRLARMAEFVNVDLWNYKGPKGQSLKKAIDYIAPYADSSVHWTRNVDPSADPFDYSEFLPMLRMATLKYGGTYYETQLKKLPNQKSIQTLRDFTLFCIPAPTSAHSRSINQGKVAGNLSNEQSREIRYYSLTGKRIQTVGSKAPSTNGVFIRCILLNNKIVNSEKTMQGFSLSPRGK
jgi:hypothetical protein